MLERTDDQEQRYDELVAALRAQFEPLAERLTPDIEPAIVYAPHQQKSE